MKCPVAMQPVVVWVLLIIATLVISHLVAYAAPESPMPMRAPKPGCPSKCGDVDIPYPFGIGEDCAWQGGDYFILTCNHSSRTPRPYIGNTEIESISLEDGEMRVLIATVSYLCFSSPNSTEPTGLEWSLNSTDSPFVISPARNEFTAIGCYTQPLLQGRADASYFAGCISTCVSLDAAALDGEDCAGLGCCQTRIPRGLDAVEVRWNNGNDTNPAWSYPPVATLS